MGLRSAREAGGGGDGGLPRLRPADELRAEAAERAAAEEVRQRRMVERKAEDAQRVALDREHSKRMRSLEALTARLEMRHGVGVVRRVFAAWAQVARASSVARLALDGTSRRMKRMDLRRTVGKWSSECRKARSLERCSRALLHRNRRRPRASAPGVQSTIQASGGESGSSRVLTALTVCESVCYSSDGVARRRSTAQRAIGVWRRRRL